MKRSVGIHRLFAWLLTFNLVFSPLAALAGPTIPGFYGKHANLVPPGANSLPQIQHIVDGVAGLEKVGDNRLVVRQDKEHAIVEWKSFDIGAEAWTHFDQQGNANWRALNRIYDQNPSQIFGRLSADGHVYLINQNGVLFGKGARVDVQGLVASSLNLDAADFLDNRLYFRTENINGRDDNSVYDSDAAVAGVVANEGEIVTGVQGSVFLIGSRVENSGAIESPAGQVGLVAAREVDIVPTDPGALGHPDPFRVAKEVRVREVQPDGHAYPGDPQGLTAAGEAVNSVTGRIVTDLGTAGMYGRVVNQEGLIRSVTAIKRSGRIELLASERVVTGPDSVTATPVSESAETVNETFNFSGGWITIDGLDPQNPLSPKVHPDSVVHQGLLYAPSGKVKVAAGERIYLDDGSRIDVSGSQVARAAEGSHITVQLNSQELKNDQWQRDGILRGEKVTLDKHLGSAIGDMSGVLQTEERTALESSTDGGMVELRATGDNGDIIMAPAAEIDISGGGIHNAAGASHTTILVAGNRGYALHEAPGTLAYDALIGKGTPQQRIHQRFGIVERYEGLLYGGVAALGNYKAAYFEGSHAGTLQLLAHRVLLAGSLAASAETGHYQTELIDPLDAQGYLQARGRAIPRGGRLLLGDPDVQSIGAGIDHEVDRLVVTAAAPSDFGAFVDDPAGAAYPVALAGRSVISAERLNQSGLGDVRLAANTDIVFEAGAAVTLAPAASLTAYSRAIEHQGRIEIPAGSITFLTRNNITNTDAGGPVTFGAAVPEVTLDRRAAEPPDGSAASDRIVLGAGSLLSTAGRRSIYRLAATVAPIISSHLNGGTITLNDLSTTGDGVLVNAGAALDVSGGYRIDQDGTVHGAAAGTLAMRGPAIVLAGDLRGHSLEGQAGGTLALHAAGIEMGSGGAAPVPHLGIGTVLPETLRERLDLSVDALALTGFTHLHLTSRDDLVVAPGTVLTPSRVKMASPLSGSALPGAMAFNRTASRSAAIPGTDGRFVLVEADLAGASSITLAAGRETTAEAGENTAARVVVGGDASLNLFPSGRVTIRGPAVEIAGRIAAPSGDIAITASQYDLVLASEAAIDARGYNLPMADSGSYRLGYRFAPLDGGTVSLAAPNGALILSSGAAVDVSGAAPVAVPVLRSDGAVDYHRQAANPGSVQMTFKDLSWHGAVRATATLQGAPGGDLQLYRTDESAEGLRATGEQLAAFTAAGFDSVRLGSRTRLVFGEDISHRFGRYLALDAPLIEVQGGHTVDLEAPWVAFENTYWPSATAALGGDSSLRLSGEWIDVRGDIRLVGIGDATLQASRDVRLAESRYVLGTNTTWGGRLALDGDLTIGAARIYPTTLSRYTLAGATLTTLAGAADGSPIASALGHLTLAADNLAHYGVLAAPMGRIDFQGRAGADSAMDRLYLAAGSRIATGGSTPVNAGAFSDPDLVASWSTYLGTARAAAVEGAPETAITVQADEAILMPGALVDLSGGGSIFAYQFQPGVQGTVDPLSRADQYVILPDNPVSAPGQGVYLQGVVGLGDGFYTLLPTSHAFTPGALVVTIGGPAAATANAHQLRDGAWVVTGYLGDAASGLRLSAARRVAVQPAATVLAQGDFMIAEQVAGNSGALSIMADTTLFRATLAATPLPGFTGASIAMAGRQVVVGGAESVLPADFGFADSLDGMDVRHQLLLDAAAFAAPAGGDTAGTGIDTLALGSEALTETITLLSGSRLDARQVVLAARDQVTLMAGAAVSGSGREGHARLISSQGAIRIDEGALVHAGDAIDLDAPRLTLLGELQVDNSTLNLAGDVIHVVGASGIVPDDPDALYITERLWRRFDSIETIGLVSRSDLVFHGDVAFTAGHSLILDAARITGADADVTLDANAIHLRHSLGPDADPLLMTGAGRLAFKADTIVAGPGRLRIDGFAEVAFYARQALAFDGTGRLTVDADLTLAAGHITAGVPGLGAAVGGPADYTVDTGAYLLRTAAIADAPPSAAASVGGALTFRGRAIDHAGTIAMPAGHVTLHATGAAAQDGIVLRSGAFIIAPGAVQSRVVAGETAVDLYRAGQVTLRADNGDVLVHDGARVDLSHGADDDALQGLDAARLAEAVAAGHLDAGRLALIAPEGTVRLAGRLEGWSALGRGGTLRVDAGRLPDGSDGGLSQWLSAINGWNHNGRARNFDHHMEIRVRQGDVALEAAAAMVAEAVTVAADSGRLDIHGTIVSRGAADGGTVQLLAGGDLRLHAGSTVDAAGTSGHGGAVLLRSDRGTVVTDGADGDRATARIDLGGSAGGGLAIGAARRDTTGDGLDDHLDVALGGVVAGADRITVEAIKTYGDGDHDGVIDGELAGWLAEAATFMDTHGAAITADIISGSGGLDASTRFLLAPGIVVRSEADLTVAGSGWNLTNRRFGPDNAAAHITLRAAGNLAVQQSITDTPAMATANGSSTLTLVAGADPAAADPLATRAGPGTLSLAPGRAVTTRDGALRFASGGNTTLAAAGTTETMVNAIRYGIGTYEGPITGRVGAALIVNSSAIQTTTGDIDITVDGDLTLTQSAIRTLGSPAADDGLFRFWEYAGGGSIRLAVGGTITAPLRDSAWDVSYRYDYQDETSARVRTQMWGAGYEGVNATQGIAALAGGSVAIHAGKDFFGQAGTFGRGDLRIAGGGTIDGRFLNRSGDLTLTAMGAIGALAGNTTVLEMGDTRALLRADGDLRLGTVSNPTLFRNSDFHELTYAPGSRAALRAVTGDITLTGTYPYAITSTNAQANVWVLPPTLEAAAGGDIDLPKKLALVPANEGNLVLLAGGDISAEITARDDGIHMADFDPASLYGKFRPLHTPGYRHVHARLFAGYNTTDAVPVYWGTERPVTVKAGGDLVNLSLYLRKPARIMAGNDIRDLYYQGQNLTVRDITAIVAGHDILFAPMQLGKDKVGVEHGGPGLLTVAAGNAIDLGKSRGVSTVANQSTRYSGDYYSASGSTLLMLAGFAPAGDEVGVRAFFDALRDAGNSYSRLLAAGELEGAADAVETARREFIDPLFGEALRTGSGNIDMINSRIRTTGAPSDIFIVAGGAVNVGKSTITLPGAGSGGTDDPIGITTTDGGSVNIFSRGDMNVNESRTMTFFGGDITIWSDAGNINAGRGSRSALNVQRGKVVCDSQGNCAYRFSPPAVGSGVRTWTFDPDGAEGPLEAPEAGDAYIFAPEGEIDAGEAGISARNVTLGAVTVINAQNIEVTGLSVGVPDAGAVTGSLAGLAGAGALSETSKLAEEQAGLSSARERFDRYVSALADTLVPKWIAVEVIGFGEPDAAPADEKDER